MSAQQLFFKVPETKKHFYARGDAGHRRTCSTNLDAVQGVKPKLGHRRTVSNTAIDFKMLFAANPMPAIPLIEESKREPLTPDSLSSLPQKSEPKEALPQTQSFMSLLDAAVTYFNTEDGVDRALPVRSFQEFEALQQRVIALSQECEQQEAANTELLRKVEEQRTLCDQWEQTVLRLEAEQHELDESLRRVSVQLVQEQDKTRELESTLLSVSGMSYQKKPIIVKQIAKASPNTGETVRRHFRSDSQHLRYN